MPYAPLALTGMSSANLWMLQNGLLVLPTFDPTATPTMWVSGTSYMVFNATFNMDGDGSGNGTGSIVVTSTDSGLVATPALTGPVVGSHPPPDPVTNAFVTNAASVTSVTGGLSLSFGSSTFGPIGLFDSVDDALTGVISQGAVAGQEFWLLQPIETTATIWTSPGGGRALVQPSPVPPQLQFPLTAVITIPVQ
jgi:hypothetical protein